MSYGNPPPRDHDLTAVSPPLRCARHPEANATFTCSRCGDFRCAACRSESDPWPMCHPCHEQHLARIEAFLAPDRFSLPQLLLTLAGVALLGCVLFALSLLIAW